MIIKKVTGTHSDEVASNIRQSFLQRTGTTTKAYEYLNYWCSSNCSNFLELTAYYLRP